MKRRYWERDRCLADLDKISVRLAPQKLLWVVSPVAKVRSVGDVHGKAPGSEAAVPELEEGLDGTLGMVKETTLA
jgi:hypothetical protein